LRSASVWSIGVILFLDYDGVLHPDPCKDVSRLFENAPRLAHALDMFPGVGIVLSTSWRTVKTREQLLAPLPEIVRQRVLGINPNFGDFSAPARLVPYRRHAECDQWLRTHSMSDGPWLALDDRPEWFAPYCDNLIECNPRVGLDERVRARLVSTLTMAKVRERRGLDLEVA